MDIIVGRAVSEIRFAVCFSMNLATLRMDASPPVRDYGLQIQMHTSFCAHHVLHHTWGTDPIDGEIRSLLLLLPRGCSAMGKLSMTLIDN